MFERRLKIFLLTLLLATLGLLVRAERIQVAHHADYETKAAKMAVRAVSIETTRGQILDSKGRVLATDEPCTDACVDYRAIIKEPDKKWVHDLAKARYASRVGPGFSKLPAEKQTALEDEIRSDIKSMWAKLADLYVPAPGDADTDATTAIDEIRDQIVQDVTMQRRALWFHIYSANKKKAGDLPEWEKFFAGQSDNGPDADSQPEGFIEELKPHVILPRISAEVINELGRHLDRYPGLALMPGTVRRYPMNEIACHVIGRLGRVSEDDEKKNPAVALAKYSQREYKPGDLIGNEGIEKFCEPLLRGARGEIDENSQGQAIADPKEAVGGVDVQLTIDAALQGEAQNMLKHVCPHYSDGSVEPEPGFNMHGAIVVIDVKTGGLIVLASNPDFDANVNERQHEAMSADALETPLRDRATLDQFEPGSTIKPMIGLAGITAGVVKPLEGIECTGYLMLPMFDKDGHPVIGADGRQEKERQLHGRCWVASEYTLSELLEATKNLPHPITSQAHHPIPLAAPHRGHDGNPDGFLTYSDALERSCNVYFETVADRLGWADLEKWYSQFGFGRATYIGIEEGSGRIPNGEHITPGEERMTRCLAGIGEGQVWATPLQIANEAATIARGGIWMRPSLLKPETRAVLDGVRTRDPKEPADRVDLSLDAAGLEQARIGMIEVVNGGAAGTGPMAHRTDMIVAGKTGTAQGTPMRPRSKDKDGNIVYGPALQPANRKNPPTERLWYRSDDPEGQKIDHAWFMGFAPADKPQIAFCVLVEYAGEGGGNGVAGSVAKQLLEACVQQGYLHPTGATAPMAELGN